MDEEKRGEEEEKCEVMARPETISSTVVIKKADALMSPFLQLKQVSATLSSQKRWGDTVTVLFFGMECSTTLINPVNVLLLQNADLNLPPPDWLRTNSPAGPAVFVSQTQFTTKRNKRDPSRYVPTVKLCKRARWHDRLSL